jgi:hypothetical protein
MLGDIEAFELMFAGYPQRRDGNGEPELRRNPITLNIRDQGGCDVVERILERVAVGFAGPDPQRVIDRRYEYLAVADLAGARA